MALPPPKAGKKPAPGKSSKIPADLPSDVGPPPPDAGLPPDAGPDMPGADMGGAPMGGDPMAGGPPPGAPMGPAGPPQFPSADPNAILGLLMQLNAHDQQALGMAQVQADGAAFSQLLQSQVDPQAAAANSGPPPVTGPPMGGAGGPGY